MLSNKLNTNYFLLLLAKKINLFDLFCRIIGENNRYIYVMQNVLHHTLIIYDENIYIVCFMPSSGN